jgi:hypothetical protein
LTLALSGEDEHPTRAYHRAMLLVGETAGAELVLVDRLGAAVDAAGLDRCTGQPRAAPTGVEDAPGRPLRGRRTGPATVPAASCTRPTLTAMLALADRQHLPWLLDLSRLRERSGRLEDALVLRLSALALARRASATDASAFVEAEVRHALARGKPWIALALAQLADGDARRVFEVVIGSMLDLLDVTCGAGCTAGERIIVERVVEQHHEALGLALPAERSWSEDASARARLAARSDAPQPNPARSCVSSRALVGARAEGSLAALVERTLLEGMEPSPAELAAVVERDLTRMCSTELAVALLARAGHTLAAETLSDRYAMLPDASAARVLALEGDLALLAGETGRARERWTAAAAESADPRDVWRRAALLSDERGARHLMLEALRELERLADARQATTIRRALLIEQLAEIDVVVGGLAALESAEKAVREHLGRLPESLRWHERQTILLHLAAQRDLTSAGLALALAVVVEGDTAGKHGAALEVIAGARGLPVEAGAYHGSPLALAAAGAGASGGAAEAMASAEVWLAGSELHHVALARMRGGGDVEARVRAAVAALHVGDAQMRAEAMAWLMARTSAARETTAPRGAAASEASSPRGESASASAAQATADRVAQRRRVASGATALDPAAVLLVPAVEDPEALLRILLDLPLDAWRGLQGQ